MPPAAWFLLQLLLALATIPAGAFLVGVKSRWVAAAVAALALAVLLLWPLMRFFPLVPMSLVGARRLAMIELTGLLVPAALVFSIAARTVPRPSDRRALWLLLAVASVFFVRTGWWMVSRGVPDLGPTQLTGGVCRQTTGYTCVAASLVTLLTAHGIPATETEMAQLTMTEVNGGATDSRAVWGLERKLEMATGSGANPLLRVHYSVLDRDGLFAVPKPCLVQTDWGFFTAHMMPVLSADANTVVLGDPLQGQREQPTTDFLRHWKGRAIWLAP